LDLFDDPTKNLPFSIPQDEHYNVIWNETLRGYNITIPNGELFYAESFYSKKTSDRCLEYFQENNRVAVAEMNWTELLPSDLEDVTFSNINWQQDYIKLYGKAIPLPRLTAWYGDAGKAYTYSGITSHPKPWNEGLLYIKHSIEQKLGHSFNSVLLNWYRGGEDHMGWHCDDEKELGVNPVIASANFGVSRDFVLRKKLDKSARLSFPLKHGTLLIMRGALQHHWEHSVPKRKKAKGSRINLTFRTIF